MLITKKMLLAIGLIAALVGGGLGALITNSSQKTEAANDSYQNTQAANTGTAAERNLGNPSQFNTAPNRLRIAKVSKKAITLARRQPWARARPVTRPAAM